MDLCIPSPGNLFGSSAAMHKASDAGHIGPHGMRRCYMGTRHVPPTPPGGKKTVLFFEECSMCIKHRKYHQKWPLGGASLGRGAGTQRAKHQEENCFFGEFLIIFDVAFFWCKNLHVLSSKNYHVFDLVKT